MAKPTTIKDALRIWEEKNGKDPITVTDIGLQFQFPPIEKMDSTLNTLVNCRKLSLSSNMIEKITGINQLKNLRILSLARNNLKSINGIALGETLEELWVSYNIIEKIKPIESMKALRVFYVSHNLIKDWIEFNRMALAPKLEEISFLGNIINENMDELVFKNEAIRRLPLLKKLDGEPVIRGD
ncbi:dynein light chain 1, axonemal isoform X2 [Bactrocera tryoni]|uniref:dynein light chain 1, axonemal isoform X2 n=1 Tax=Bactrocera tryoni TaxID=59916 RepID=UPI001A9841EB|nr:dynein light chain 1, axonemal isoform X2 [Bactrocera tryoni]